MAINKIPPELPPRPYAGRNAAATPPKLPPRPTTNASPSLPVRSDWHNNAAAQQSYSLEEECTSTLADSGNTLEASNSSSSSPFVLVDQSTMQEQQRLQADLGSSSTKCLYPLEVPTIVHTSASSPETNSAIDRFPSLSRRSSIASSIYSTASQSSSGSRPHLEHRKSADSQRPFIRLYGRQSSERHYEEALEELKALEVVRLVLYTHVAI